MQPAGLVAWERRKEGKLKIYAYEQAPKQFSEAFIKQLQVNLKGWNFFGKLAPDYTKNTIHWVMSAKREETRLRRFGILVKSCEAGLLPPPMPQK